MGEKQAQSMKTEHCSAISKEGPKSSLFLVKVVIIRLNLHLSCEPAGPSEEVDLNLTPTLSRTGILSQTELVEVSHPQSRCLLLSSLTPILSPNPSQMRPSVTLQSKRDEAGLAGRSF